MDERRESGPPPETRQAHIAPTGWPPLTQQARNTYVDHIADCPTCRDIDRARCETGKRLWRDWNTVCDDAFRRLRETQ